MKAESFANRLKQAMNIANVKQIDLANRTNIDKSLINKYIKGVAEAGNDNLPLIAKALNVSEVWLMGYDVPINSEQENKNHNNISELDQYKILFDKDDKLTPDQKEFFIDMIETQHRKFDEAQENGNVN